MADLWTSKLSEYVDGTLSAADRQALEGHLVDCGDCRVVLDDLQRIVSGASALGDQAPTADLWPGIEGRIRPSVTDIRDLGAERRRRWRVSLTLPQLAAAGIALMLVSFALASQLGPRSTTTTASSGDTAPVLHVGTARSQAVFAQAVAELQEILESGRGRLDSTTIRALETNLAIIDRAISEAQQAVSADSANGYLRDHLEQTQRRKLDVMRRAADLIAVAS
jgi:anti-sigma-K factor RskA